MAGCHCGCGGGCGKSNPRAHRNQLRLTRARMNPEEGATLSPAMSLVALLAMGAIVVAAYSRLPQS